MSSIRSQSFTAADPFTFSVFSPGAVGDDNERAAAEPAAVVRLLMAIRSCPSREDDSSHELSSMATEFVVVGAPGRSGVGDLFSGLTSRVDERSIARPRDDMPLQLQSLSFLATERSRGRHSFPPAVFSAGHLSAAPFRSRTPNRYSNTGM